MRRFAIPVVVAVVSLASARPLLAQVRDAEVTGGRLTGVETSGIVSFKGIPFAAPPVGALRWKAGFVFRNLANGRGGGPTPAESALSELMSSYWTNFAKTGDPNGPGLPTWPSVTASDQRVMYFDGTSVAMPLPNGPQLKALDDYFAAR